ncbi:hypothetical protein P170DRAFT_430353 [Aspergillus steynii IBT 23096]|uniref:C2H2-type domain-containing protein n=1 Tax=Aspergillus steynii IBT 23096 TaxID=1392250 RepID=A0A2I2FV26_9EURO|nr:uncharacterized protein P170DRAFT_430353 [Aspergillus steynii IBT 23096]PLB44461.1 hypothetical protein P170DRAFT_430353 [Aspergillus steynii IBT 23096]
MMDSSPTYSSPMRSVPNYVPHSQPPAGLGISHCDMGPSAEQSRVYTSEQYPSPTTDWSDQIMPPESVLDAAMDVGPFSPATQYEPFGGYPDVSASPLSYYSSQTLSASPEYGVPMDIAGHHDMMPSQSSDMWPNANCSDEACKIKEEPNDFWNPSLFPITNAPTTPVMAPMPQLVANNNRFPHPQQAGSINGTLVELDPNVDRLSERSVAQSHPYEVILKWTKNNGEASNDDRSKIPSASGLECTTCGTRFTRRSNCREHMKKHDPSRRKMYHCETCERRFGRRTDLRRHVDSIHRGIRKFSCDVCDQKFSRQDTLTRHRSDCERRKRRAAKAKRDKEIGDAPQSPSAAASPEIKMEPNFPDM